MDRRRLTQLLLASTAAPAAPLASAHPTANGKFAGFPITAAERAASVSPADLAYPPGTPERYGAIGDGHTDDTAALATAILCNTVLTFTAARSYGINTVTFPQGKLFVVNFNGAQLRGIATSPTDCIVKLETDGSTFIAYDVDLNFNSNYACGTWWYNAAASSQYNTFLGMKHSHGVRGLVYGALPGRSSTRLAQSENSIYGFRTRGVQNPFYGNHANGVLFFSQPIFVSHNEEWPHEPPFDWGRARAFENHAGIVHVDGGEIQLAATTAGYAADLCNCWFQGTIIETSEPIRIIGDFVRISSARTFMTRDDQPQFHVQDNVRGRLRFADVCFQRPPGLGAYSHQPIVHAANADPDFEVCMSGTESFEWLWSARGANVRLVHGATVRYVNHRMSITAADPSNYVLNSGAASLLDGRNLDRFGYSTTGWHLNRSSGTAHLTASPGAGPRNYPAVRLSLAAAGYASASHVDTSNAGALSASALRVRPGETYMIAMQICRSGGADAGIIADLYASNGDLLSTMILADAAAVTSSWEEIQAPLTIPASVAFFGAGVYASAGNVLWTDLRVSRCS